MKPRLGSFKVTGNDTVQQVVYNVLFVFNSNYGCILQTAFWAHK